MYIYICIYIYTYIHIYIYMYVYIRLHLISSNGETCYKGKVAKACCPERLPGNKQACKWVRAKRGGGRTKRDLYVTKI